MPYREPIEPKGVLNLLETVDVLGVPVACVATEHILHYVAESIDARQERTIAYVNAHCLNIASRDPRYRSILNQCDLIYPDGIGVVWAGWLLARGRMKKSTGADWIEQFCRLAAHQGWRIYILAGRPGIASRARERLVQRHPTLKIVGAYDGFFIEKSQHDVIRDIAHTTPHVLFVGMGTPIQEKWIAAYRHAMPVPVCWAIGALFDYVAGIEPRVPVWMNILALEWLWRLLVDPLGKWRRYIVGNPLFVARVLQQKLRQRGSST